MSTHTKYQGATWPSVVSRSQRIAWAREILRGELSVKLPPDTIECDDDLRELALAILHSLAFDRALEEA